MDLMGVATESVISYLVIAVVVALEIAAWWKIFTKAGRPGWYAVIPFWNLWHTCQIARRPGWWLFLYFVPFVNIVIDLIVMIDLARAFKKGTGFGVGLWLLPGLFALILGFGPSKYHQARHLAGSPHPA
jgi:Family of unknown function (DUF5684)